MYKVFIADRPIIIKRRQDATVELRDGHLHFHASDRSELQRILALLDSDADIRAIYVYNNDPEFVYTEFTQLFTTVEAAGGFVTNEAGEALFIFRRGQWDLPKGKIDPGESLQAAAMREVSEECGIGDLHIEKALPMTYHVYHEKGERILKPTHWFAMSTSDKSEPQPETEENITEVRWVARKHWRELVKGSYPNIVELIELVLAEG